MFVGFSDGWTTGAFGWPAWFVVESNESPTGPSKGVFSRLALQYSSKMAKSSITLLIGEKELVTVEMFFVCGTNRVTGF